MTSISCVVSLAISCERPPNLTSAIVEGEPGSVTYTLKSVITYTCSDGMRFDGGYTVKNISCVGLNLWSETNILSCDGECSACRFHLKNISLNHEYNAR